MNQPGKESISTMSFKSLKSSVAEHKLWSKLTFQKIS